MIRECNKLAQKECKIRKGDAYKIAWYFVLQTVDLIQTSKPHLGLIKKKKRTQLMDCDVLVCTKEKTKGSEIIIKYLDLM